MKKNRNLTLFMLEGMFFSLATSLGGNIKNLFLTKLGASDYQLSFAQMFAQFFSMLMLIPLAIFTDRLKNKRSMVVAMAGLVGICYLSAGICAFFGQDSISVIIIFIGLAVGSASLCTSTWQAFFADVVVTPNERNQTISMRQRAMVCVNCIIPPLAGYIVTLQANVESQIHMYQIYFLCIAIAMSCNIFLITRIKGGENKQIIQRKALPELKEAIGSLSHNRHFLFFAAIACLFYLTWTMDGTIFYLGQTKFIGLNDFTYIISNVCCSIAQMISIPFWMKVTQKKGTRFTVMFGVAAMVVNPLGICLPILIGGSYKIYLHLFLRLMFDIPFTTIPLNILQNLLEVIDEKHKSLSIAVYTTCQALVCAMGPIIGVRFMHLFGDDGLALCKGFFIVMALRAIPFVLFVIRYKVLKGVKKLN